MNRKILVLSSCLILSSCATDEQNKLLGQIIGAGAGALLGSQIGGGVGNLIATAAGAMIGTYIATEIMDALSEQDQKEYSEFTISSLENAEDNETNKWTSSENENVDGEVTVTKSFVQDEKNCRNVKQKVNVDGKDIIKTTSFCRNSEGNWEKV